MTSDGFKPILSLGGCYEIDRHGNFRNAATKKIYAHGLYFCDCESVPVTFNKRKTSRSVNKLLLETFGIEFLRKDSRACSAQKDGTVKHFKSLDACAEFLSENTKYAFSTIRNKLKYREFFIADWKITYKEND